MPRKQRVEVYLPPDVIAEIDEQDGSRSEFIRQAVEDYL